MITFYYGISNLSSRKIDSWFQEMGIQFCRKKIKEMSKEDLFRIVLLSDRGFLEILKTEGRTSETYEQIIQECQDMYFNVALDFIMEHLELVRTPLIFDDHKLMVGYDVEEIRKFPSQSYRKQKLKRIMLQ